MSIEMQNRPTRAGVYWQQANLPVRMSVPDLQRLLGNTSLPANPEHGIYAGMFYVDDNGHKVQLDRQGLETWLTDRDLPIEVKPQFAALGEAGSQIAIAFGYYLLLEKEIPPMPGLMGPPVKTVFDMNGKIISESDEYGNTWTPQATAMNGFGAAQALAGWAALEGLVTASIVILNVLLIAGIVASVWVLTTVLIKTADQIRHFYNRFIKPTLEMLPKGKELGTALFFIGGGFLLWWWIWGRR